RATNPWGGSVVSVLVSFRIVQRPPRPRWHRPSGVRTALYVDGRRTVALLSGGPAPASPPRHGYGGPCVDRHSDKSRYERVAPANSTCRSRSANTYTIFEGTSEIQRLVIARAISGV